MRYFRNPNFISFCFLILIKPGCISGIPVLGILDTLLNMIRIMLVLFTLIVLFKNAQLLPVAGKVNVTHIVQPHDSRQSAGAFHSDPVVEHLDLDVGPFDAVIAVRNGIDDKLLPRELRVFRLRDKARIRAEVGALLDLASHKLQRFLCHLKDAPLKHHVLDDVHPCADPCLRSFVTHEADTGAGKEVLLSAGSKEMERYLFPCRAFRKR